MAAAHELIACNKYAGKMTRPAVLALEAAEKQVTVCWLLMTRQEHSASSSSTVTSAVCMVVMLQ
jgi:hypothetical protein